jgi:hypothetical protein
MHFISRYCILVHIFRPVYFMFNTSKMLLLGIEITEIQSKVYLIMLTVLKADLFL